MPDSFSLARTSFAATRLLLAMDPLRDPRGVLLNLDHFALSTASSSSDRWLVNLVESDRVRIRYRDSDFDSDGDNIEARLPIKAYECGLLEMPNWAYSYSLALFRLSGDEPDDDGVEEAKRKADAAIIEAMKKFPSVVGLLLQENDVETSGRSFRRDWIPVLDYASSRAMRQQNSWQDAGSTNPVLTAATLQAVDLIVQIFARQNARLWSDERTLQWMHDTLKELQGTDPDGVADPPSPALIRYVSSDTAQYDNKIPQLPQDVNILDPNLIQQAMVVDPNRGRFLRGNNNNNARGLAGWVGGGDRNIWQGEDGAMWMPDLVPRGLLGPPTHTVNPDWPLLEVRNA